MAVRIDSLRFKWEDCFWYFRNQNNYSRYKFKIFVVHGSSIQDFRYSNITKYHKSFYFLEINFLDIEYTHDKGRKFLVRGRGQ